MRPTAAAHSSRQTWAAYAAAAWAFVFAAMSFYWALGGTLGVDTLGDFVSTLASDPELIAFVWITGILKVLAGLLALTLMAGGPFRRPPLRRLVLITTWVAGAVLTVYGVALIIQHGLMATGVIGIPETLGARALPWHLLLWDPWWLLGGVLFTLAAWQQSRPQVRLDKAASP